MLLCRGGKSALLCLFTAMKYVESRTEKERAMEENEQKQTESTSQSVKDRAELDSMEIEIFRQHWRSLNAALAEIRELRGADAPEVDPVEFVKHEVSNLRNQFAELKQMISQIQQPAQQTQQQNQQAFQRFQPVQQPVPILPYYSTPNFAPIVPINQ
jgi:predicted  nucleic acid-binding Zn-ribbon protein